MQSEKKSHLLIITLVVLVFVVAGALWYFFMHRPGGGTVSNNNSSSGQGFTPFGRTDVSQQGNTSSSGSSQNGTTTPEPIPVLRELSATPIGGYGASTTASTTIVRWADRGRGNILEATEDSLTIKTLSNTLLPKVYNSSWNASLSSFVTSILSDDNNTVSTIFATLVPRATTTDATPYELRGKNLPDGIKEYAVSPLKDKVFFFIVKNGQGIGYTAPLAGGAATQIFSTPLTQINVEWPTENTIAITTKGTATENGFLYFVDPKTGTWKKILGSLPGLSTRVSHDGKFVLFSATGKNDDVVTFIYSVASSTVNDAVIHTLADKCAWGNFYKDMVYCAVPFQPVSGVYPDDWYKGTLSTVDKIWQVNAVTGEIHLISSVFSEAKQNIDAFHLGLDDKDNYLFFMNKNDLSFWSLDLVSNDSQNQ